MDFHSDFSFLKAPVLLDHYCWIILQNDFWNKLPVVDLTRGLCLSKKFNI